MADTKISALTSATTPLNGTEVLPVVQSGTTKKVAVNDLTAGKQVPALKVNIGSGTQTDDVLHIEGATSSDARQRIVNTAAGQSSEIRFGDDTNADGGLIIKGGSSYPSYGGANSFVIWNNRNAPLVFGTNDTNCGEFAAGGNFLVRIGNIVVNTSGKGVELPGGITWTSGAGSPEGVVTAPVGSLYSRSDGGLLTSLYVKQSGSGNTGWVGK
jgi:hypothetical protein